jgi:hypothetical protein
MRVFLTKAMARFVRQEEICESTLHKAIVRAEHGRIDADLGNGLIKQRVARPGKGKSGGYRTLIAYRRGDRAIFLFGFAKSEKENIDAQELCGVRELANYWLKAGAGHIEEALANHTIREVPSYDQTT